MKSTRSPTEFDQNNCGVTSIPGYAIKKNRKRGVQHGASERQKMYFQAKQMLKKARQGKQRTSTRLRELKEFRLRIIGF